jgi:hypothetical protein
MQLLMESKVEQDAMNAALGQKVDKKTFYDVLHFVVNNFEGAKEFINAQVRTISTVEVQTDRPEFSVNNDEKQGEEV